MKYKVGDEIIVVNAGKAYIQSFFQGKVLVITRIVNDQLWVNTDDFYNSEYNTKWSKGYVLEQGIRLLTPLERTLL